MHSTLAQCMSASALLSGVLVVGVARVYCFCEAYSVGLAAGPGFGRSDRGLVSGNGAVKVRSRRGLVCNGWYGACSGVDVDFPGWHRLRAPGFGAFGWDALDASVGCVAARGCWRSADVQLSVRLVRKRECDVMFFGAGHENKYRPECLLYHAACLYCINISVCTGTLFDRNSQ